MKIQIVTLGCSKNRVDSEHILAQVSDMYEVVPEESMEPVDVQVLNTCGFIGDAKEESIQAILESVERKKAGEIGRIIVCGCLSERYLQELPAEIPEVDAWFGARNPDEIVEALGCTPEAAKATRRVLSTPQHYAYLKIAEGCDRRCSYCAIPHIRGAHRSVPMEDLVQEAEFLAAKGVKELIVVAQDTTYYGLDLYHRRALAELLQKLSEVEGIEWIRIHYSYPDNFPEDVIDQMANNPKVCAYLDIPLQHVADKVLTNMRRHVTGEWTRNLIRRMRERVPGIVIRTTMMVGHPGEGKREFNELLEFIKEARFERLGAFQYSEEEGTYGALMFKDTVTKKEKQRRFDELMTAQSEISLAYNQSRVGTRETVIVDDFSDGVFVCRSKYESPEVDGEILAKYDAGAMEGVDPYSLIGEFIGVEIIGADDYDLIANVVEF